MAPSNSLLYKIQYSHGGRLGEAVVMVTHLRTVHFLPSNLDNSAFTNCAMASMRALRVKTVAGEACIGDVRPVALLDCCAT